MKHPIASIAEPSQLAAGNMLPLLLLSVFGLARGMSSVLVGAGSDCRIAMSSDGTKMVAGLDGGSLYTSIWDLVKGFSLSYHTKETILVTMDPYGGNLN